MRTDLGKKDLPDENNQVTAGGEGTGFLFLYLALLRKSKYDTGFINEAHNTEMNLHWSVNTGLGIQKSDRSVPWAELPHAAGMTKNWRKKKM